MNPDPLDFEEVLEDLIRDESVAVLGGGGEE